MMCAHEGEEPQGYERDEQYLGVSLPHRTSVPRDSGGSLRDPLRQAAEPEDHGDE